jgi:argininosuccinate lyase
MWGGRFSGETDKQVADFTQSIDVDAHLYKYDIAGSIAHAEMLAAQQIIPEKDAEQIISGLKAIQNRIEAGEFQFDPELEDVHMNIESALTDEIGEVGARLHTGRSRNDQIATDERLWLREEIDELMRLVVNLQRALVETAQRFPEAILPGFTHLQHAQPVLWAHHLLAYVEMFERDRERLADCRKRVNRSPLGAGALAGATLPIDREATAGKLGFDSVLQNSMDAVADRDYILELLGALSILAVHWSRISEDIILWASQEFAFVALDDAFCTGSSLMPQKKNPDVAEIARGKTGAVIGALNGMLMTMKGLPLTYNRDLQEDKQGILTALETAKSVLGVFTPMVATMTFRQEPALKAVSDPFLMATDLAEWLVRQGVPFRTAHHRVGGLVKYCERNDRAMNALTLDEMQSIIPEAEEEALSLFDAKKSVNARTVLGGTAPSCVSKQLGAWQQYFAELQ